MVTLIDLLATSHLIKVNWRKNYRHQGGASALSRCLVGTLRLRATSSWKNRAVHQVDCLTFSVVPRMTAIWAAFIHRAITSSTKRVIVGDCSGGFHRARQPGLEATVIPFLNYGHGQKLDIFMQKVCQAEYVVVSDDDVFWLDNVPWDWVMASFEANSRLAIASLVPRERFRWNINGEFRQPMGSYCLVLRREIWLRENLSFKQVALPSPNPKSYKGQYDTADFANLELLRRGYEVVVAPPEIRSHLAVFKGLSSGLVRIQKDPDDGFLDQLDKPEALLYVAYAVQGLGQIAAELWPACKPHIVSPGLLNKVQEALEPHLTGDEIKEIQTRVNDQLNLMSTSLKTNSHSMETRRKV
jgi:hypothetical protein